MHSLETMEIRNAETCARLTGDRYRKNRSAQFSADLSRFPSVVYEHFVKVFLKHGVRYI